MVLIHFLGNHKDQECPASGLERGKREQSLSFFFFQKEESTGDRDKRKVSQPGTGIINNKVNRC